MELAFPNFGAWYLAPVSLALLYFATSRAGLWWNFLMGLTWGLAFFLPHIFWAYISVGVVPWIALSVAESIFVGLFAVSWTIARRWKPVANQLRWHPIVFPVIWGLWEFARSEVPFGGFPWGRVGFSQADSPVGRLAWLAGTHFVSIVVAALGVLIAIAVASFLTLNLLQGATAALVASAVLFSGLLVSLDTRAETGILHVALVQGNIEDPGNPSDEHQRAVLFNHVDGSLKLLDEVKPGELDLVVWPENASDIPISRNVARDAVASTSLALDAPMIVGTQEYLPEGGRYNLSVLWLPGVGAVDQYAKQHPAPFAEYVPMRSFARIFSKEVDRVVNDMLPGNSPGILTLPSTKLNRDVKLGVAICFEVAYDSIVYESVELGAELLIVPTNNANFGWTAESTQQLAMSRMRAIESGRSVVHASTVGVSGIISPNGAVKQSTELFTADQLHQEVVLRNSITPAVFLGVWPAIALSGIAVLFILLGLFRRAKD